MGELFNSSEIFGGKRDSRPAQEQAAGDGLLSQIFKEVIAPKASAAVRRTAEELSSPIPSNEPRSEADSEENPNSWLNTLGKFSLAALSAFSSRKNGKRTLEYNPETSSEEPVIDLKQDKDGVYR